MILNLGAYGSQPPFRLAKKELLTEVTPPRASALLDDLPF